MGERSPTAQWAALAVVVTASAGLATLWTGDVRLVFSGFLGLVIVVALIYLITGLTPVKVIVRDVIRWHYRRNYLIALHPLSSATSPPRMQVVLQNPRHRKLIMGNASNPDIAMPGLRCEVKQYGRRKGVQTCEAPYELGPGHVGTIFPAAFTRQLGQSAEVAQGAYVIRWKRSGRRRAFAKVAVFYDGDMFRPHPLVRPYVRMKQVMAHLQDLESAQ